VQSGLYINGNISLTSTGLFQATTFTVSGLPTCNASSKGQLAYVTDASAPTFNATLTGGSTTVALAFCNGTAWTAH
jgi:hypothetical protein